MTDDLAAFIAARLDEDEAAAKGLMMATRFLGQEPDFTGCGGPAAAAYWEHFPPHQRLREVAAKRAIVVLAFEHEEIIDSEWGCAHSSEEIAAGSCPRKNPGNISILRHLAAVWSDHPDYRAEWRP